MKQFGVEVETLVAHEGEGEFHIPNILVYLCEHMRDACVEASSTSDPARFIEITNGEFDMELYKSTKEAFNDENFHNCGSNACMFKLLKSFLRELPTPIIPSHHYNACLVICEKTMQKRLASMLACPEFRKACLQRYREVIVNADIKVGESDVENAMIDGMPIASIMEASWTMNHPALTRDQRRYMDEVDRVILRIATHPRYSLSFLEEFFFSLPKENRMLLEYLCVNAVEWNLWYLRCYKDYMDRKPQTHAKWLEEYSSTSFLSTLCLQFASHVIRPFVFETKSLPYWRKQRLHTAFFKLLVAFFKRKHNKLTVDERNQADMPEDAFLQKAAAGLSRKFALPSLLTRQTRTMSEVSRDFTFVISSDGEVDVNEYDSAWIGGEDCLYKNNTSMSYPVLGTAAPLSTQRYLQRPRSDTNASVKSTVSSGSRLRTVTNVTEDGVNDLPHVVGSVEVKYHIDKTGCYYAIAKKMMDDDYDNYDKDVSTQSSSHLVPLIEVTWDQSSFASLIISSNNDDNTNAYSNIPMNDGNTTICPDSSQNKTQPLSDHSLLEINTMMRNDVLLEEVLTECPQLAERVRASFIPFDSDSDTNMFALNPVKSFSTKEIVFAQSLIKSAHQHPSVTNGTHIEGSSASGITDGLMDLIFSYHDNPSHDTTRMNIEHAPFHTDAINYDYVLAFPRTFDSGAREGRLEQRLLTPVQRFLTYEKSIKKHPYFADKSVELLNHQLPVQLDVLEGGGYTHCDECNKQFTLGRRRVVCRYCCHTLCADCCNCMFIVPSYILHKANFQEHHLCCGCHDHLFANFKAPLLSLDAACPALLKHYKKKRFMQLYQLRLEIQQFVYFNIIPLCPSGNSVISLIPKDILGFVVQFSFHEGPRVSMADLIRLSDDAIINTLEHVRNMLSAHVNACTWCSGSHRQVCCAHERCMVYEKEQTEEAKRRAGVPDDVRKRVRYTFDTSNSVNTTIITNEHTMSTNDKDEEDGEDEDDLVIGRLDGNESRQESDDDDEKEADGMDMIENIEGKSQLHNKANLRNVTFSDTTAIIAHHNIGKDLNMSGIVPIQEMDTSSLQSTHRPMEEGATIDIRTDTLKLCTSCLRYGHRQCMHISSGECLLCQDMNGQNLNASVIEEDPYLYDVANRFYFGEEEEEESDCAKKGQEEL
eukprot:m.74261 g.74261  ORF g.74261 m.74261 type:complete len:1157 (+) comp8446_c0_seq1:50-3520(+)